MSMISAFGRARRTVRPLSSSRTAMRIRSWNQHFEGNIGSCTTFGTLELEDLRCTLSTTSAESEGMKMSWDTVSEPGIGPQAPASPQVSSIPRS